MSAEDDKFVATIRRYWANRGYDIDVSLAAVPMPEGKVHDRHYYHAVRSNLRGGLPPEEARLKGVKPEPDPLAIPFLGKVS